MSHFDDLRQGEGETLRSRRSDLSPSGEFRSLDRTWALTIRPAFGVKAANLSRRIRTLGTPVRRRCAEGLSPIPFHFYESLTWRHNDLRIHDRSGGFAQGPVNSREDPSTSGRKDSCVFLRKEIKQASGAGVDDATHSVRSPTVQFPEGNVNPLSIEHEPRGPSGVQRRRPVRFLHSPSRRGAPVEVDQAGLREPTGTWRAFEERRVLPHRPLCVARWVYSSTPTTPDEQVPTESP